MKKTRITFRIYRFRPGDADTGHFEENSLAVGAATTVLDVLEKLRGRDPGLMYRHSCHHASCGTCACRINGREALACMTRVLDLNTPVVTLEPLSKFRKVGDLVVDPVDFFREFPASWQTLRRSEAQPDASAPRELPGYTRLENCIECGACVSACPVEDFLGPAVLAALNRERGNRPDAEDGLLDLAAADRGVGRCRRVLECSRVCPSGVYPARHIQDLRDKLKR